MENANIQMRLFGWFSNTVSVSFFLQWCVHFRLISVHRYIPFCYKCSSLRSLILFNPLCILSLQVLDPLLTLYWIYLQNENEAGKPIPVTKHWSWKKSSISIVTSLEGDESKLLMRCASLNVRSKSGSKTVAWSGRKKISPKLMAMDWTTHLQAHNKVEKLLLYKKPRQISSFNPPKKIFTTPELSI